MNTSSHPSVASLFFCRGTGHHSPGSHASRPLHPPLPPATLLLAFLLLLGTPARGVDAAQQGIPVTVVPLETLLFHPAREAPATVVSLNDSLISAEIAGKVEEVTRRPGDEVREGDLLARLDCSTYVIARERAEAAMEAAKARFKYARQRFKDAEKLVKARNISSDEFNQRSSEFNRLAAELNVHQADLEEAKWQESRCTIKAPFDAVVTARKASRGDYATPGTPIVRLVDLNNLEVSAQIQQQDIAEMEKARALEFRMGQEHFPLRLRAIVPMLKSRIRSYEARYLFTGEEAPPGAAGRLYWESPEPHIPANFLVQRNGQLGLFLYDEGIARFHAIPGAVQGLPARVALPPATRVIDVGRYSVEDGDAVQIVEP